MQQKDFIQTGEGMRVDANYLESFEKLGLTSIDSVFAFYGGIDLSKKNLASYRSRVKFQTNLPQHNVFMKRYKNPPIMIQLANWLCQHCRRSLAITEMLVADRLTDTGINTPRTIAFGEKWNHLFEAESFIVTEEIPHSASLEEKFPDFSADDHNSPEQNKRGFIRRLARFVAKFHGTGYRHRDLYFSHIFYSDDGKFYLIDLARAFRPLFTKRRYRIKDVAQLYYSAPGRFFSGTDRLRFYLAMVDKRHISTEDKKFIRKVTAKAKKMAKHDRKHSRTVPYKI